jgi:hypothetical protein
MESSAAPSVALVTLSLALIKQGPNYVNLEGRSMVLGAGPLSLSTASAFANY